MKNPRNTWYEVTCIGDHWFVDKNNNKSSHKKCKTLKKAISVANGVKNLHPDKEVMILKYFFKDGKRWVTEYVYEN